MAEELQHLIERIQREAVDTGEQQATKIVTQAKEKAAAIVKDAELKASAVMERAEKESQQFALRGQQALAQAARDLLITIGGGVEKIFERLVARATHEALDADTLAPILGRVVDAYMKDGGRGQSLEVVLGTEDKEKLEQFFRQRFARELADGIQLSSDSRMVRGFKVRLRDQHIEHDFSKEAIAEAVSVFLRPILAETVYKIAREQ